MFPGTPGANAEMPRANMPQPAAHRNALLAAGFACRITARVTDLPDQGADDHPPGGAGDIADAPSRPARTLVPSFVLRDDRRGNTAALAHLVALAPDRKSTRLNSRHRC